MKRQVKLFLMLTLLSAPVLSAMAAGLPHTFTAGTPALAEEVNENFRYVAPPNVVYVNSITGGTAVDNGAALLEALDPANLTAINGAPSGSNPYLIKVGPGHYDLGSIPAILSPFVHLEGSGQGVTSVASSVPYSSGGGTIVLASNTSVSRLTVTNYASSVITVGVLADGIDFAEIRDVDMAITATGTSNIALYAYNSAKVNVTDVAVTSVATSGNHIPFRASFGAQLNLNNVTIDMTGSALGMIGVSVQFGAKVLARNVAVAVQNANGSGRVYGVSVEHSGSEASIQDGRIRVSGGDTNYRNPLRIDGATAVLTVNHSTILNGTGTADEHFLYAGSSGGKVRVGASHLAPHVYTYPSGATGVFVKCAYVYDTDYNQVGTCSGPMY